MADNDLDSGQSAGTSASPNADGSQGKGDSSGSFDAAKLQSTIEALTRKLDEVDQRSKALQGDKDRGVDQARKEVSELKRKIAEIEKLKKAGLDEDGAIEEHAFREDIRAVKEQLSKLVPAQVESAGNGANPTDEAARLFKEYGVDANDPAATRFLSLKGDALEAAVAGYAFKQSKVAPPDSSTASSITGSPPPAAPGVEKLTEDYKKEMRASVGSANAAKRESLKAKYSKLGVDIYNIDFT